jgi:hypothetical protein
MSKRQRQTYRSDGALHVANIHHAAAAASSRAAATPQAPAPAASAAINAASSAPAPPRVIPGFVYDAATNRYFLVSAARQLHAPPAVQMRIDQERAAEKRALAAQQEAAAAAEATQRRRDAEARGTAVTERQKACLSVFQHVLARASSHWQSRLSPPHDLLVRNLDARAVPAHANPLQRLMANNAISLDIESGVLVLAGTAPGLGAQCSRISVALAREPPRRASGSCVSPPRRDQCLVSARPHSDEVVYPPLASGAVSCARVTRTVDGTVLLAESMFGGSDDGCFALHVARDRGIAAAAAVSEWDTRFSLPVAHSSVWSFALASDFARSGRVAVGASNHALLFDVERARRSGDGGAQPLRATQTRFISSGKSDVFHSLFVDDDRTLLFGSRDGRIRAWDLRAPGSHVATITASAATTSSSSSSSSQSAPNRVAPLRCASSICWFAQPHSSGGGDLADGDAHLLVVTTMNHGVQLWDRRRSDRAVLDFAGHSNGHHMLRATLNEGGTHLFAGGEDGRVRAWCVAGHGLDAAAVYQSAPLLGDPVSAAGGDRADRVRGGAGHNGSAPKPRIVRQLLCVPAKFATRECLVVGADGGTECISLPQW